MEHPSTTVPLSITCGRRVLDFSARPYLMGIVNVTPDSFSDGGSYGSPDAAVAHALDLIGQGADLIDVGGESTRPGAEPVTEQEELRRVLPVVRELAARGAVPISIDTMKAEVARRALAAGASMVNDVSALEHDADMAAVVAEAGVPVVLMHMPAPPAVMQRHTDYDDVVQEICRYLERRIVAACEAGIARENIIIDPGIGFGKSVAAGNLIIIRRLRELGALGRPVLVGPSRKAFIKKIVGEDVFARDAGTAAACALGIANGAHILRVHNVALLRPAALVAHAIAGGESCT